MGFRTFGKSKDSRDDLPQVVIGMAVTRAGIPVRVWCWPGNTSDSALIRQAREDMRDWTLSRVMWVADRGFSSAANRRELRRGGGHYIIGEKLRSGSAEATAALSRQGRYQHVRDNLQVKEVKIAADERFVICYNPEQADRDRALREVMTSKLATLIADTDRLSATKRAELRGQISTMPGLNRFLRLTPGGLLRIDKKKINAEANLDGKYLLRCS
uniref:IS1634 family transposase n=1 Tax=Pseudonocardia asaccharolytica TaxID=54010 RepID=UPI001649D4BA